MVLEASSGKSAKRKQAALPRHIKRRGMVLEVHDETVRVREERGEEKYA